MCLDLGESCGENVKGGVRFVFFVFANTKDSGKWQGTPCLACCEARKNEIGGDFAEAVIVSKTCEFVELRGVVRCDLACPEGTIQDCSVWGCQLWCC